MRGFFIGKNQNLTYRFLSSLIVCLLTVSLVFSPVSSYAQVGANVSMMLPAPGAMVSMSPAFNPIIIKGITIYPDNPLRFDFIIDTGDTDLQGKEFEEESTRLIKYFLASLTVPEDELWVNLSPYEKDRIIPDGLSITEMGRDLLFQDYMLKQLTASLMYPEDNLGDKFWKRVYQKAQERFGTTNIPINTFNKVWIVPDKAVVYEHNGGAYIGERHLKVMLEEDYLALKANMDSENFGTDNLSKDEVENLSNVSSEIVREVIIPEIEKEVNEGSNFANLRQIFNSMILATWYKKNLRESLLGQVYMDQNKIEGIDLNDKDIKEKIYQKYLEAFRKGVFSYIKEDYDPESRSIIPRKYFSGGVAPGVVKVDSLETHDLAMLSKLEQANVVGPESKGGTIKRVTTDLRERTVPPIDSVGSSNWGIGKNDSYEEPSDEQLIEEINFEIRSRYGGDVENADLKGVIQSVFNDIAVAMGVNPQEYTVHILGTKSTANAFASPGNHIWITWAALEGVYREHYIEMGRDGAQRRKFNVKPVTFFADVQSLPLALAHELGHQINGDTTVLLKRFRNARREAILGKSEYRANWQNIYDSILPGGRTFRQEMAADKFSVESVEEAGYPTRDILRIHLQEGRTYDSEHPSEASRGWREGILSTRLPRERASKNASRTLAWLDSWRSRYAEDARTSKISYPFEYSNPWEAIDRLSTHYELIRYNDNVSDAIKDHIVRAFQQAILEILNSNTDIDTLGRLWKAFSRLTSGERPLMKSTGQYGGVNVDEELVLNKSTELTTEISQKLSQLVKKNEPSFSGSIDFTEENIAVPEDTSGIDSRDARTIQSRYSMQNQLARSIGAHFRTAYEEGRVSFTEFLNYHLSLPLHDRKNRVYDVLAIAKTPEDLAEGYYFIIRTGGRYWNSTGAIELQNPKDAIPRWAKASYVIGSMYEEIQRGLYDGEHILLMRERGWFPKGLNINETIRLFLKFFAREDSPLYRSAEAWTAGDLTGLLYLYQEYASQPDELKVILDEEGKNFFDGKRKARFRIPLTPFGATFKQAIDANVNLAVDYGSQMSKGYGGQGNRVFLSNDFELSDFSNPETQIRDLITAIAQDAGEKIPQEMSPEEGIEWLNESILPFRIYATHMQKSDLSPEGKTIVESVEEQIPMSELNDEIMERLNGHNAGRKLKVAILKARFPDRAPSNKTVVILPTEQDYLRLGLHGMSGGESHLRSIEYSPKLAKEYFDAPEGIKAEEAALEKMIAELDENRKKSGLSLRQSHILEHHFMGMHPMRSYKKRAKLLQAVLAGAERAEQLPTFTETGKTMPKYRVEDRHIYDEHKEFYQDGMSGDTAFHMPYARYENHYAAALGRLYEVVQSTEDAEHMLKTFDFTKAPLVKLKLEVLRFYYLSTDPLESSASFNEALDVLDQYFSLDNPYRWILFDNIWARFGYDLNGTPLERVLASLPNLHYFSRGSKLKTAALNAEMLKDFFDNLGPREIRKKLEEKYSLVFMDMFVRTVQTLEREIYEAAINGNRLSPDVGERLNQIKTIFRSSTDTGASHPTLDRARWAYMQTLDVDSDEYKELQDEIKDPEIKTKAAIPILERELKRSGNISHERQRDLISQHLPVGEERDRYVDEHLKKAKGLTKTEIERYAKLYSSHPKSETRKSKALVYFELDRVRRLKPEEKLQLILFFLSHGNRALLKDMKRREQEVLYDVANYLFERNSDEQINFFTNLFMGEDSIFEDPEIEEQLANIVLFAGEGMLPRYRKSLLTALFESLYRSMDLWDRGYLLSELIVDSQSPQRVNTITIPQHSPERVVKMLRLIKGFGPKAAQVLRSHKAILGETEEAGRYREAFKEFEEKAQRIDLVDSIQVIEKAFSGNFHQYFQSIDGILGAGSVKKILLATLRDGRKVAVKYMDMDYGRRVQRSLEVLRRAIREMETWRDQFPDLPILESILTAVEQDIEKEQNLLREHAIYRAMREKVQKRAKLLGNQFALFPITHDELGLPETDGRVIVEEAFEVISLDDMTSFQERDIDRNVVIRMHIREQLEELLVDGVYDYDARPANWTTLQTAEGDVKLGYFDKSQSLLLSPTEHEGLLEMLFAMNTNNVPSFRNGLIKFEESLADTFASNGRLNEVIQTAMTREGTNPYLIIQDIVTQLENLGVPMSASKSLKLSMWLRQLDRYVQMLPGFDVKAEIVNIIMSKKKGELKGAFGSVFKKSSSSSSSSPTTEGSSSKDSAMTAQKDVGGIDLNPTMLNLQIRRDGNGVPLPIYEQPIEYLNIEGFTPVIINISPVTVPMLLGDESSKDDAYELSYSK